MTGTEHTIRQIWTENMPPMATMALAWCSCGEVITAVSSDQRTAKKLVERKHRQHAQKGGQS